MLVVLYDITRKLYGLWLVYRSELYDINVLDYMDYMDIIVLP